MSDSMPSEHQQKLRNWIRRNFADIKSWYDDLPDEVDVECSPLVQACGRASMDLGFPVGSRAFVSAWDVVAEESQESEGP